MHKKILCPVDGSAASNKAVLFALQLSRLLNIPLSFVSVYATHHHEQPNVEVVSEQAARADPALASAAQAIAGMGGPPIRFVRLYGKDIAGILVEFAETDQYDHIVMGSTGRRGVSRLLMGSVANEVVLRAHCPVTIIR